MPRTTTPNEKRKAAHLIRTGQVCCSVTEADGMERILNEPETQPDFRSCVDRDCYTNLIYWIGEENKPRDYSEMDRFGRMGTAYGRCNAASLI